MKEDIDAMNDTTETTNNQSNATLLTPGKILQQARQQSKWTTTDIAKKLFLKPFQIEHLENDEYHEETFMYERGYLRSYAKLLKIPENFILQALERVSLPQVVPHTIQCAPKTFFCGIQPLKLSQYFYLFTGLLVLMVIIATGFWYAHFNATKNLDSLAAALPTHVSIQANAENEPIDKRNTSSMVVSKSMDLSVTPQASSNGPSSKKTASNKPDGIESPDNNPEEEMNTGSDETLISSLNNPTMPTSSVDAANLGLKDKMTPPSKHVSYKKANKKT